MSKEKEEKKERDIYKKNLVKLKAFIKKVEEDKKKNK